MIRVNWINSFDWVTVLSLVIGFCASFLVDRCKSMPIAPETIREKLIKYFKWVPAIVAVLGIINFNTDKILTLFQKSCWGIGAFSLILALVPPLMAYIERKKDPTAAEKGYAIKNLGFNLLGVASVWCMLFTLYREVADFRFLKTIPVASIISLTIPLCLWVVLSYQSTEQEEQKKEREQEQKKGQKEEQKEEREQKINHINHDTSLSRINQILNILHLFSAFFCSLTCAAFIFAYSLHCRLTHVELALDVWYLAALSILLVFFYVCGFHSLPHIRMVCMSNVPAILIASVYWMSWFQVSRQVLFYQSIFIVAHSLIYVTIIYRNMNFYADDKNEEQINLWGRLLSMVRHPKQAIEKIGQKFVKYQYYFITLIVVTAIYGVFIFIPYYVAQQSVLSLNLSKKIITAVCEETDRDVDAIFEELKKTEWANPETNTIDCVQFADFIYDTLRSELLEKNIIAPDEKSMSYDQLKRWFDS